uniref:WD40/YVTN/BNR-like repeat-containing protein n=1 Tax=Aquiflexum sp. TaxID=1872584 RepID=UPI0035946651
MKFRSSFYMIMLLLLSMACTDEGPNQEPQLFTLNPLGLVNTTVNQLALKDNRLYAMTTKGIYVKNINEQGNFRLLGFEGENIEDAVIFSENDILVSFRDIVFFSEKEPALYRTLNGGESWAKVENNFGGGEFPEAIHDFEVHPTIPNLIYATGSQVIAKSSDTGVTWEPVWG